MMSTSAWVRGCPILAAAMMSVLACAFGVAGVAQADAGPKIRSGWYGPVGFNFGGAIHGEGVSNGFLLGAEGSLVHFDASDLGLWVGGYVDALGDFGADALRASIGPEIGYRLVGVDAGYVLDVSPLGVHHGICVRPVVTVAIFALYGRFGYLFTREEAPTFGEIGLLVKIPLDVATHPVRPHGQR